jgi:hypothetical protein
MGRGEMYRIDVIQDRTHVHSQIGREGGMPESARKMNDELACYGASQLVWMKSG